MDVISASILVILGSSLGLIGLGLVAGFSPVLYLAQASAAAKSRAPEHAMITLMIGVLASTVLIGLLFLFFHPDTLSYFFEKALGPLLVSSWFHVILGVSFIAMGLWGLSAPPIPKNKKPTSSTPNAPWLLFSAGFLKTLLSPSSAVAIFFATQLIVRSEGGLVTQAILVAIFLTGSLLPFAILYGVWKKSPDTIDTSSEVLTQWLQKIHYRELTSLAIVSAGILIVAAALIGQSLT